MKIILAPMEGVVDFHMRELLTALGGIDQCVTEFVRISDRVLPAKVFHRTSPELARGGKTSAGTPVVLQILGSNPGLMAANARKAASLGAPAIDINFGCPAKTVNKNKGGAILLETPDLVHDIVDAVRKAVPESIPVTAKMRLGFADKSLALDNAKAIETAGAASLAVHARTKVEGYKPPAHWEWIARIKDHVDLPVVANGEVWDFEDYQRCKQVSGCQHIMIGRGLIAVPDLGRQIKDRLAGETVAPLSWFDVVNLLLNYLDNLSGHVAPRYQHGRIKQWLHMMKKSYHQADIFFQQVKQLNDPAELRMMLCKLQQQQADI